MGFEVRELWANELYYNTARVEVQGGARHQSGDDWHSQLTFMADFKCNVVPEVIVLSDSDGGGSNESTVSPAAADGLEKYAYRFTGCVDYVALPRGIARAWGGFPGARILGSTLHCTVGERRILPGRLCLYTRL